MRIFLSLTLVVIALSAQAQGYKSEEDVQLTIRTLTLLPVFDNMRGIYSRPVESFLTDKLKGGHRFEYVEAGTSGPVLTPDELEEDPAAVKNIFQGLSADAFVATSITKGPSGVSLKMDLFLKSDQQLLAQESVNGVQRFDTEGIKKQCDDLLERLIKKIPYTGLILSRQGTRVTLNMGTKDGIQADQVLPVIQIIKSVRHPRFHFLVNTEKEVIGKIKILKVDDTLSFGRIFTEKGAGSIQPNAKIATLEDVTYANTDKLSDTESGEDALAEKPDAKVNYGKNPNAWVPEKKPKYGMVGARLGIGQFQENTNPGGGNNLSAYAAVYPIIALEGELWLTPSWSMHAQIRQGIITTTNPEPGGSPSTLSQNMQAYDFLFGYNMRLANAANAPKVEILFGYSSYQLYVDASVPPGLTTKAYSGPKLGVSGSYPIGGDSLYSLGANFYFLPRVTMSETPSASGGGSSSATSFGAFVDKQMYVNLKARFQLDFELYATTFDAGGSSSQKHTAFTGGLYYMF